MPRKRKGCHTTGVVLLDKVSNPYSQDGLCCVHGAVCGTRYLQAEVFAIQPSVSVARVSSHQHAVRETINKVDLIAPKLSRAKQRKFQTYPNINKKPGTWAESPGQRPGKRINISLQEKRRNIFPQDIRGEKEQYITHPHEGNLTIWALVAPDNPLVESHAQESVSTSRRVFQPSNVIAKSASSIY